MCSKSTISPHLEQTRWYLIRPKSSSWSWLKWSDFSSVAVNRPTGTDTRPNEMAPFHIALGITHLQGRRPQPVKDGHCTADLRRFRRTPWVPNTRGVRQRFLPELPWVNASEALLRPSVHTRISQTPPRTAGRRALVDDRRRARAAFVQPGQGVLARGAIHQRRPDRLLLQHRRSDPAVPGRAAPHHEADAERHHGAVLLCEAG